MVLEQPCQYSTIFQLPVSQSHCQKNPYQALFVFFSINVSNIVPAAFCPDTNSRILTNTFFCLFESPISNILLIDALIKGMVSLFPLD